METLDIALCVLAGLFGVEAAGQAVLWIAGFRTARAEPETDGAGGVLVLVPAHDEAELLPACLASLRRQSLAPERVRILVLADRCTDETATIAREANCEVIERFEGPAGKGPLLAWALGTLRGSPEADGAVAVLDADSVASPQWLERSLGVLQSGADAVQAHHGVRRAGAGPIERLMSASAAVRRRILGAADRLGLPAPLLGTGMVFSPGTLAGGWSGTGLTEDRDMGLRLLRRGCRIRYLAGEEVLSEPPQDLRAARTQRLRWTQGERDVMRRHALPLLWKGVRGDPASLVAGLGTLLPSPALRLALLLLLLGVAVVYAGPVPALALAGVLLLESAPRVLTLVSSGPEGWKALLCAPLFVVWKSFLVLRSLVFRQRTWQTAREGRGA